MTATITYNGTTLSGSGFASTTSFGDEGGFDWYGFALRTRDIGGTSWDIKNGMGGVFPPEWAPIVPPPADNTSFSVTFSNISVGKEIQVVKYHEWDISTYGSGMELNDLSNIYQYQGVSAIDITAIVISSSQVSSTVEVVTVLTVVVACSSTSSLGVTVELVDANSVFLEPIAIQSLSISGATITVIPIALLETATMISLSSVVATLETTNLKVKGNVILNGQPVISANIFILNESGTRHYKTTTDSGGYYEVAVAPDTYHAFCLFKDGNEKVFSSSIKPYISAVS